jgi:ribosomal protein S18 acetylase RimI-like enzyme
VPAVPVAPTASTAFAPPADLGGLADRALADAALHIASHSGAGAAQDQGGLVLFAGSHPYPGPYGNGMVRLRRSLAAEHAIARAQEFFAPRHRGFIVWTRTDADHDLIESCRARGWYERPPADGMPLIACVRDVGGEIDERIVWARTPAHAREYLSVLAEAYEIPDAPQPMLEAIFLSPAALLAPQAIVALLCHEGRPAAGATVLLGHGVACLMWTATAPWARGNGFGPTCLRAVTHAAFERGARLAVGQSSQMGLRHWTALGFEVVSTYRRFLAPPPRCLSTFVGR